MVTRVLLISLVSISLLHFTSGQCNQFRDCDSCISHSVDCVWCADSSATGCSNSSDNVACGTPDESPSRIIQSPNNPFDQNTQIRPQAAAVTLRVGDSQTLNFSFRPSSNYPLDVYILMDFGMSMSDDFLFFRDNIDAVVDALSAASSNLHIGFGTFVDKPISSYLGIDLNDFVNINCILVRTCWAPHSFIHHVNLSAPAEFKTDFNAALLSATRIQASAADPVLSSGLDAIVQVASCDELIGWRSEVNGLAPRRTLVYISDRAFHLSGESWIGGQVRRSTGECHLSPDPGLSTEPDRDPFIGRLSDYYRAVREEYASPSLVQSRLSENDIRPIFLVTADQTDTFNTLRESLSQNTALQYEIMDDSSNLITTLERAFSNVSTTIRLSPEVVDNVEIQVRASCATPTQPETCEGVEVNQEHDFNVTITVLQCTDELRNGVVLPISDPWLGTLNINISGLCQCECQLIQDINHTFCQFRGNRSCGVCTCEPTYYGKMCNCTKAATEDVPVCPTSEVGDCSGQGTCDECNRCQCNSDYYGDSCECSDVTCGFSGGKICSDNGVCICNECNCAQGFGQRPGSDVNICDCPINDSSNCQDSVSENECNNRGDCLCNQCTCRPGYTGDQCGICTESEFCSNYDCIRVSRCLDCLVAISPDQQLSISDVESCKSVCGDIDLVQVQNANDQRLEGVTRHSCTMSLSTCELNYFIAVGTNQERVFYQQSPSNCPVYLPPWAYALIAFFVLLIIGIIILALLKLIIYLLDYFEYKKFQDDVARTKFGETENPLYRKPETEHPNPLFKGKSTSPSSNIPVKEKCE